MPSYHQMGHDSWNLIDEESLRGYAGMILSPVNDAPSDVTTRLGKLGETRARLEVILDPQFYKPTSDRGKLAQWKHMGSEIETADLSDIAWWSNRCDLLLEAATEVGADATCSPAILPRVFNDEYYSHAIACADMLAVKAGTTFGVLATAIVALSELAQKGRAEHIASILSASKGSRIYLVFYDNLSPRTQRTDQLAMAGGARLIRLLEASGIKTLVAFSGLDFVVWKAAGAAHVATGKFFNLRRYVPGRWEEPQEGGRIIPYWTDDSLIAWLREDDLRLLDSKGLIDRQAAAANPYSTEILQIIDSGLPKPWVGLSWRQYLYWFRQVEAAIDADSQLSLTMLEAADTHWQRISDEKLYLFDRENTGNWIRPWMNAINVSRA